MDVLSPALTSAGPVTGSNLSGTNTGNQTITLSGDVSGSGTAGITVTIGANKVTLAMLATMATASFLGRNSASTGNVEVLAASTVRTMLSISNVDNTSDANKPVSTATQTALNLKANKANETFTGTTTTAALTTNGVTTHTDEVRLNATTPYLVFQNSGVQKGLIYTTSNIMFLNASDAAGEFRMQINGNTLLRQEATRLTLSTVLRAHNASSDPSGANGDFYYNSTTNKFRGYAAGAWVDLH